MNMNETLVKYSRGNKAKITLEYSPDEILAITVEKSEAKEKVTIDNSKGCFLTDTFLAYSIRELLDECDKKED